MSKRVNWRVDVAGNRILADDPRETIICHLSASCRNPEVMQDALLLAAAPDLLEALTEMLTGEDSELVGLEYKEKMHAAKKHARAAIAKATGGEP